MDTAPALRIVEVDDGARDADRPLVLDVWCDFACPDCAAGLDVIDALRERFDGALTVRFRHMPLVGHVWAVAAAQLFEAASAQGAGEPFARIALQSIGDIEWPVDYLDLAASLGLDTAAMVASLQSGEFARHVHMDHAQGRDLGVVGTPTFVVAGLLVDAGKTLDGAQDVLAERIASTLVTTPTTDTEATR